MESLSGRIAMVTGGTRGIGRAIAERLLREGAAVALCGRSADTVEVAVLALKPLGKVFGHPADVTDRAQVRGFFQAVDAEFGGLDILVNNAGAGHFAKAGEMSPEDWLANIDLNLNAPFYCSQEALARFARRGGGFIVQISSLAAINAFRGGAGYNAAKAGLNLFTEAMMLDHRYDDVRFSSIMPGSVSTAGFGGSADWKIAPEDVAEAVAMVLRMPARTMVSRVELRPSQPKK